jgi:hypothetical protein
VRLHGISTLQPVLLLQRDNNAPGSFGNVSLATGCGCAQQHLRAPIPIGLRLAPLLEVGDELRRVGDRLQLRRRAARRLDDLAELAVEVRPNSSRTSREFRKVPILLRKSPMREVSCASASWRL